MMRTVLLFLGNLLLVLLCNTTKSFSNSLDSTYLEGGIGLGTHKQLKLGVNHQFQRYHLVSVQGTFHFKPADDIPEGHGGNLLNIKPQEYQLMLSLLYGNVMDLGSRVRFCPRVGLTGGCHFYPQYNLQYIMSTSGPVYTKSDESEPIFGLVVNPSTEFMFGNWAVGTGIYANITGAATIFALELNILLGTSGE